MTAMAQLRRNMVDCQLRTYDVTQLAVLDAFETIPRDAFVPPAARDLAYLDRPVPLGGTQGRALLTPMVAARMIQALGIRPGDRVLDYAGGTGYTATILAHLGAEVTLVEPDQALADVARATLSSLGVTGVSVSDALPAGTSFDAVLVNGACDEEPTALIDRLADGGRLVMIQGQGRSGRVMLANRTGGRLSARPVFDAAAPLLPEFAAKPAFAL